jgi:putative MATE family efflux protein
MKNKRIDLGSGKVGKVLMRLSVPATIGMIVMGLYNLVDTIFVGRGAGILAIAGIAIAFPVQMIISAIGQMIGIGGASLVSRSMGAEDYHKAKKAIGNSLTAAFIISIIITFLGITFLEEILNIFGATENILPYAKDYLYVIILGSIFFIFGMTTNNIIRSEGKAKTAMTSLIISAGLNIILDPIFIFKFGMGIRGAAIATVISQSFAAIYLSFYYFTNKQLRLSFIDFIPDKNILKEIFSVGFSAFARQVGGSITAIVVNNALRIYGGDLAISVYGAINRLMMFTFMPMFGIVQGMMPIIGFAYGAKNSLRIKKTLKISISITTLMSALAFSLLMFFPREMIGIFSNSKEMAELGVEATRKIILMFPTIGFQVVASSLFQAIGKALPSFILSSSRQILLLIPFVIVLSRIFGLGGIWYAFPLSDGISLIATYFMYKKEIKNIEEKFK